MEINKTSAQKLDNNVQVAQATTTKPAIKTAEGTSFKDAVSMMSDIEVANNTKTDIKPTNTTETVGKNADAVKDFKFISTTENKTSFDKTLNKENLTQNQKLSIHEKAEKELVKEIVLVNNKQVELKANKNENQIAQVSTAIKSDKEIETEKMINQNYIKTTLMSLICWIYQAITEINNQTWMTTQKLQATLIQLKFLTIQII